MTTATHAGAVYALIVFIITNATTPIRHRGPIRRGTASRSTDQRHTNQLAASMIGVSTHTAVVSPRPGATSNTLTVPKTPMLIAAEFVLGGLVFGRSVGEQLAAYGFHGRRNRPRGPSHLRDLSADADFGSARLGYKIAV